MKILIACEESQEVCKAFRSKGHEAYSCDILPCSGGHPEWHIHGLYMDALRAIYGSGLEKIGWLTLETGDHVFIEKWDLIIAHPPCTYLTCSAEWAYKEPPYHQKVKPGTLTGQDRVMARGEAFEFFMALWNAPCDKIAVENPIGIMSRYFRQPDQIIQPYQFGDDASKATCLWLRGLDCLLGTEYITPRIVNGKQRWGNQTDSGQNNLPPTKDRARLRSKTYPGIAAAMANQWNF